MRKYELLSAALGPALGLVLLGACGSQSQRPPVTSGEAMQPAARTQPPAPPASERPAEGQGERGATAGVVFIEPSLRETCKLETKDTYFAFDSARLEGTAEYTLQQLANCFVGGPMQGHELLLIGHADPRGGSEYNLLLAGRRAEKVAEALTGFGLPPDRIETSSRGEMDATGTEPRSWAQDRRVDVRAR